MNKKSIIEATDEELFSVLEGGELDSVHFDSDNDVYEFVRVFRLTKGNNLVTAKLIHRLYKQWSKNPKDKRAFTRDLGLLIEQGKSNGEGCFCINLKEDELLKKTLEYLKSLDRTKSKQYKDHFDNYLNKYDIKAGSFHVKDNVMYNLYDKWIYKNKKRHPLSFFNFIRFCKLYFKYKVVDKHYWFAVDNSIIRYLSEEMISELTGARSEKAKIKKR